MPALNEKIKKKYFCLLLITFVFFCFVLAFAFDMCYIKANR